jgi:hypothetical protein
LLHPFVDPLRAVSDLQLEHDMPNTSIVARYGHTCNLRTRVYTQSNGLNFTTGAIFQTDDERNTMNHNCFTLPQQHLRAPQGARHEGTSVLV